MDRDPAKERTGKLRRDIVEDVVIALDVALKVKSEQDVDFFELRIDEIARTIGSELHKTINIVRRKLNRAD